MTTITRLFDFPYFQLEHYNISDALVTKYDGVWVKTSTKEYIAKANAVSRALLRMGVQKDDKIALISTNKTTEPNGISWTLGFYKPAHKPCLFTLLFPKKNTNIY